MSKLDQRTNTADWQGRYSEMITTAAEAVTRIRPGSRVFVGTGCAEPQELVRAMTARHTDLTDIEIIHLMTMGDAPYTAPNMEHHFRVNSLFISENVRDVIVAGFGDYTPIHLSDIPQQFVSGQIPIDVALIQVSPPDEHGKCSLGVSVDIVKTATENAGLVIAQVNPHMPRTLGDSFLDVYDLDLLVPVDSPLIEVPPAAADDETRRIGQHVASLVEDGSTVEFGIGTIPQTLVPFLKDCRDLGIHTEMLTDSIIDLIEAGAVTGTSKTLDRGKVVASFCVGTRRLYDYVADNPMFAFYPTEYVNDPHIISQQHKQVAINGAMSIDLTGQVCADSADMRFCSGGGQVDFSRGSARSRGGKSIVVLPSTVDFGASSRIVVNLPPGASVATPRADVHYVVTEHGVAYLHGKSIEERAIALISIAHPKFRAQLLHEAVDAKYLRPDFASVEGKLLIGPPEFRTSHLLRDGTMINFRPIHPTDEHRMRDLFYALSQETLYYRFMSRPKQLRPQEVHEYVFINHRSDVAIVGTIPEAHGEDIIAIGRYYLNEQTNLAEVAFVVRDDWQKRGIGTFLYRHLANIARRNGIRGFTAEVLRDNRAMQRVFSKSDNKVTSKPNADTISFLIEF